MPVEAERGATDRRTEAERPAPQHAGHVIVAVETRRPLKHVAVQVVQPERVRFLFSHGMRLPLALEFRVLVVPGVVVQTFLIVAEAELSRN